MNEDNILQEIMFKLDSGNIVLTNHSRVRMFQSNISTASIINSIRTAEILEMYEDDFPCPSYLLLVKVDGEQLHIVLANCLDHIRVVTVSP